MDRLRGRTKEDVRSSLGNNIVVASASSLSHAGKLHFCYLHGATVARTSSQANVCGEDDETSGSNTIGDLDR